MPTILNFSIYETTGMTYFNEWGCSQPPATFRLLHDWTPFRWLHRPLAWAGVLREYFDRGECGWKPRWLSDLVWWRPFSGIAYRLWCWAGRPGYLDRINLG